jgi:hypothetical protein
MYNHYSDGLIGEFQTIEYDPRESFVVYAQRLRLAAQRVPVFAPGDMKPATLQSLLLNQFVNGLPKEISALHPQTNGKCERFNGFLKKALSMIIDKERSDWDLLVDCVLFAYRTTLNARVNEVPFYLIYGRDPVLPVDLAFGMEPPTTGDPPSLLDYKADLVNRLTKAYCELGHRKELEMARSKNYYDRNQRDIRFTVGDLVMVYWPAAKLGIAKKLLPLWRGPFKILKQLSQVTYRIAKGSTTLPVHVQRLRRYVPYEPTDLQVRPGRLGPAATDSEDFSN